jgi:ABC-type oligopeptide transport system substrate-binding subunit
MSRPTSRIALLSLVCLLGAFGLVACGSSDKKTDSSGSTTASTSSDTTSTDTGTTSTGASTSANSDALTELFFKTVHDQVTKQGLSPAVADCIETQLRASVTPAELDQIKTGKRPASLRQKATAAGASCAQKAISGK